ncbi:MAG: hypothetical protein JF888_13015 [Candidatus Dormibacteraeota bacterium]|uniref:Uncharacterized protein n=1 Tax=Candidatus Dormiibacter inghamiae TaxID=3127013 RepID=A0A934KJT3_9BACT|nr:hypothetical protein [Candidatus Dormibacteraeota bacterium]MBJ7605834.1 hypothetical protein [Candidatus Dormibacteraeota bacterium]
MAAEPSARRRLSGALAELLLVAGLTVAAAGLGGAKDRPSAPLVGALR